ncbi:MAG TPA: AMP-binding protein, partial [Microthrixaceae bacterium]|nr:AMP-binding protein [Microthrixaceae bacterium]
QVIPGYWNRPDATADAFTADGWFRTGDIGRIDAEGYLSIVDRAKDIIVTGGENVASREVEDALAAHPDIAAVAVVGVAHPQWGEQVVAVATAADGATIDADAVLEWARGRLAGFKRPKALLVRDALPVNASGKVLKRDLRVWAADQLAP